MNMEQVTQKAFLCVAIIPDFVLPLAKVFFSYQRFLFSILLRFLLTEWSFTYLLKNLDIVFHVYVFASFLFMSLKINHFVSVA